MKEEYDNMERQQAKISDILGRDASKHCYFQDRFRYEPCRSCTPNYAIRCDNYFPVHTKFKQDRKNEMDKSADNYYPLDYVRNNVSTFNFRDDSSIPMIIRKNNFAIKNSSKILNWIRRANDNGVI